MSKIHSNILIDQKVIRDKIRSMERGKVIPEVLEEIAEDEWSDHQQEFAAEQVSQAIEEHFQNEEETHTTPFPRWAS